MKTQTDKDQKKNLSSQVLYAPFVKAADKVRKDPLDLSFADFQPNRFAVAYDPPTIVLEYLVPSTGKLYHHKMKLRNLSTNPSANVKETMDYLEKRHPLYFMNEKFSKDQVLKLVEKILFRRKQAQTKENKVPVTSSKAPSALGGLAPLNDIKKPAQSAKVSFTSGSSLPAVSDNLPKPSVKKNADYDLGFDLESEDSDFDANELMDLGGYNNKRKADPFSKKSPFPPVVNKKAPVKEESDNEEDDWGVGDDDWGEIKPSTAGLENFDYANKDLNKLSDYEIQRHKAHMEKDFAKNALKKGDPGFEYDKRMEFNRDEAAQESDDSWDMEAGDDDDYFDDDFA